MPKNCPDCGAEVNFSREEGPVALGRCDACQKTFAVLDGLTGVFDGTLVISEATPDASEESDEASGEGEAGARIGLECATCGSPMEVTAGEDRALRATCPGCGAIVQYVVAGAPPPRSFERRERGGPERPFRDTGRGGEGASRARPCRECGAPLRFTTGPDGTVSGECTSCGNRFVLGPRREGGERRDFRGPPRRPFGERRFGGPPGGRRGYGRRDDNRETDDRRDRRRRKKEY